MPDIAIYSDLRRLIRLAAWLSWLPILAALTMTSWGGPALQEVAVYVWSAGITIQLIVGASLVMLKYSASPRKETEYAAGAQDETLEERLAEKLRETALADPQFQDLLQKGSLGDLRYRELLLRTTIVEMLLREDPKGLSEEERRQVIAELRRGLHQNRATA